MARVLLNDGLDAKAIRQLLSAQNRVNALSKRSRSAASPSPR